MEDMAELLLHLGRYRPQVLEGERLEELAMFLLVFLASPDHVRNPYLRSKLAEVPLPPPFFVIPHPLLRPCSCSTRLCVHACFCPLPGHAAHR